MKLSKLFKALGDESRLSIVRGLLEREMYAEVLAERLALSPATVTHHLKKLEEAGLVTSRKDQYYKIFSIRETLLNKNLKSLILEISSDREEKKEDLYKNKVIQNFIKNGVLTDIPVQRKKRRIILEHLCKDFDENRVYSEKEVNELIERYHHDFCTIRRDFIAEKLMTRNKGQYQRITV